MMQCIIWHEFVESRIVNVHSRTTTVVILEEVRLIARV